MILRILTILLAFISLWLNEKSLHASCAGCCQGSSIVSEATTAALSGALPGLPAAVGLPGLSGVSGAPGIPGPPGTIGIPGGVLDYAFIYNTVGDGQNVGPGGDVPFNIPAAFTSNPIYFPPITTFDHNGTSSILFIHSPGTYIARYIVTISLAAHGVPTTFVLTLNGIPIPGSDRSTSIPPGAGELNMVGEAIFVIPAVPPLPAPGLPLTVRNNGINTFIGVSAPATTAASLFVQKLSN